VADPPSPTGVGSPTVVCADEQNDVDIDAARWAALAEGVLRAEGAIGELTLTFVDRAEMASLNAEYMGVEGPTDVLSFPLDAADSIQAGDADADNQRPDRAPPVLLGDVVLCPAIAAIAAPDHGGNLDDELALLVVHGVLHVLGHDHAEPDETAAMVERERDLLAELHWRGPVPSTFRHGSVPTIPTIPTVSPHVPAATFRQEQPDS
jgi:probable rRNA maturation factor